MALDDFAPASDLPEPKPLAPEPQAPDLDEDLFDFAALQAEQEPEGGAVQAAAGEASREDDGDDLMAEPQETASDAGADPQSKARDLSSVCSGLDPELDVDIFNFPPLDLTSLGISPGEVEPAAVEQSIEAATRSVHDLLNEDLDAPRSAPTTHPYAGSDVDFDDSEEELVGQHEHDHQREPRPRQAEPGTAPTAPQLVLPQGYAPGASKAVWVLTAAVVVFMFGLLAIAWRATSSFQQQIEQVRSDVKETTAQLQRETAGELQQIVQIQSDLIRGGSSGEARREPIPAMDAAHDTALAAARESIAIGRFAEARRTLFMLLAEADRFPPESRDELERKAAFLIATSHKREAETLREDVE